MADDTRIDVAELVQDPQNANRGTDRGRQMVKDSLSNLGSGRSIVLDKHNRIIAGNKTAEQAAALGMNSVRVIETDGSEIIAVKRTDLDLVEDSKAKRLAIADNRSSELGLDWDPISLGAMEMSGLKLAEFFTLDERADIMGAKQLLTDDDEAPPLPGTPRSKLGDLYELGPHRLLCGDATSEGDVARLMGGAPADCVWTDPPYNVNYKGGTKEALKIEGDNLSAADFSQLLHRAFARAAEALKPGGSIYVAHADTNGEQFRVAFREAGFHLASCLVWKKNAMVLGHSDYQWQHEPILYGWKRGAAHFWKGGRRQTTIQEFDATLFTQRADGSFQFKGPDGDALIIRGTDLTVEQLVTTVLEHNKPARNLDHPTMKPVALIQRNIENSTKPSQLVLDLFGGSGSTLIACEKLGRHARLLELDPAYADVIVQRWEAATGQKAVLHGSTHAGS